MVSIVIFPKIWCHFKSEDDVWSSNLVLWSQTFQVSKAAADLMAYCDAHIREDPLIVPVPASENPFREKKFFCTILWWPRRSERSGCRHGVAWLLSSSPHLKLLANRHWVEVCLADTLLLVSSVLVAEVFGGVGRQGGHPVSVSCLVLNRFVIALLLENSLAQCFMRWKITFPFYSLFLVLDPSLPQETEIFSCD